MGVSYELPTSELCRVLPRMIARAGSKRLREVGAGTGLLSRMLRDRIPVDIRATDKYPPDHPDKAFVAVTTEAFEETVLEPGEDVVVAWLHREVERLFLLMIKKNLPENVWHVGQLAGLECFSENFVARMGEMGYGYLPVPVKQFSHVDYFLGDAEVPEGVTRTATAWFSRQPFPDLAEVSKSTDLGVYRAANLDLIGDYLDKNYPHTGLDEEELRNDKTFRPVQVGPP